MTNLDESSLGLHDPPMADMVKFSSKIRPEVLDDLRKLAEETGRTLASVLNEAAEQYLGRERVRPAFRDAAEHVMEENAELLTRLAR